MSKPRLDLTKVAVIYPRQSTPAQVLNNVYSTEGQLALAKVAKDFGFSEQNIKVIVDDLGLSGQTIEDRPGLRKILADADAGRVACVITEDMSRLSRDEWAVDSLMIGALFASKGIPVWLNSGWYDLEDEHQRLGYQLNAFVTAISTSQLRSKLRRAKLTAAESGRAVTRLPKGYRKNDTVSRQDPSYGKPEIVEDDARLIRELVSKLEAAGSVRALYEQVGRFRTWSDSTPMTWSHIKKIFKNPFYRGTYKWGAVIKENNHPAIIGPEDAAMIDQVCRQNRATRRKSSPKTSGLLAGLVWCPTCLRRIESNSCNHSPSYRCQIYKPGVTRSYHFGVDARVIDGQVFGDFRRRLMADLIDGIVIKLEERQAATHAREDHETVQLERLYKQRKKMSERLVLPDLPVAAVRVVADELQAVESQIEVVEARARQAKEMDPRISFYKDLRSSERLLALLLVWDDQDIHWRRRFLGRFIERVEIREAGTKFEITIKYLDGAESTFKHRRREWTDAERQLLVTLLMDPQRPRRGLIRWLESRFVAEGFTRSPSALYKAVDALKRSDASNDGVGQPQGV